MRESLYEHCIINDRYGFTIPYLFQIQQKSGVEMDIKEILYFFANSDERYFISYCSDLEEYIIGLPKREIGNVEIYEHFGNLFYDDNKLGPFLNIDGLVRYMKDKYQKFIDNKTFSKNINSKLWE